MPRLLLILALACFLAGTAAGQEEGRAALVTSLQGSGTVVREPAPVPLRNVMVLGPGDEVRLQSGARMTLTVFQGAQRITAVGPCRLRIERSGVQMLEGSTNLVRGKGQVSPALQPGGHQVERLAGVVLHFEVPPEEGAPLNRTARTWSTAPTFTWTGGQAPFVLRVSGPEGRVWEAVTRERRLAYAGPKLREDVTYGFEVLEQASEIGSYGQFRIVSAAYRQKMRAAEESARQAVRANPKDVTPWVLLMARYNEDDLLDDAIRAAREAIKVQPADGGLHLALSKLLALAHRPDEARAEAERARKLGAED